LLAAGPPPIKRTAPMKPFRNYGRRGRSIALSTSPRRLCRASELGVTAAAREEINLQHAIINDVSARKEDAASGEIFVSHALLLPDFFTHALGPQPLRPQPIGEQKILVLCIV